MIRVFCIFRNSNGHVVSSGTVDTSQPPDGSTMLERIQTIVDKDPDYRLVTRDPADVPIFPRAGEHKIVNGVVVPLTPEEIPDPPPTPLERLEAAEAAIVDLTARVEALEGA